MCALFVRGLSSCLSPEGCPQSVESIKIVLWFEAMSVSVVIVSVGLLVDSYSFCFTVTPHASQEQNKTMSDGVDGSG